MTKIINLCVQWSMLIWLGAIPICAILVIAIYNIYYPEHFAFKDWPALIASIVAVSLALRYFQPSDHRKMLFVGFGMANILMLVSLLSFDSQLCSDYLCIAKMGEKIAEGRYSVNALSQTDYEYIFNYQTGIAAFYGLIIRIFGNSLWVFRIINLLIINISAYLTYRVGKVMVGQDGAIRGFLLFCTFYPILVTVNQFTNQHLACMLILIILLLLRKQGIIRWIVAGFLVATMDVLRPMGVIILLTVTLYSVTLLLNPSYQRGKKVSALILLIIFMACDFTAQAAYDQMFINLGYTDAPISQKKLPYFKFDKGLTGYDEPEIEKHGGSIEAFNQWEKDKLVQTIQHNPQVIAIYVTSKMTRYLGEYDWKFENTYNHNPEIYEPYPIRGFVLFGWAQYIIYAILALYGYNIWRKSHNVDMFQIFFVGISYVYVFIEAFSSYRYESYPIFLIFAGYGWYIFQSKVVKSGWLLHCKKSTNITPAI